MHHHLQYLVDSREIRRLNQDESHQVQHPCHQVGHEGQGGALLEVQVGHLSVMVVVLVHSSVTRRKKGDSYYHQYLHLLVVGYS